ncbi:transposase [Sagittula sp. NFXS13]
MCDMALRQTNDFVESLLALLCLNWQVEDFSKLSRRRKTYAVPVPYRNSRRPLHVLIPIGTGQPRAPGSRLRATASGTPASMTVASGKPGPRFISPSTRKHLTSEPFISRHAICIANLPGGASAGTLSARVSDPAPPIPARSERPARIARPDQIPPDDQTGSVTAPSWQVASHSPVGQLTAPAIRTTATISTTCPAVNSYLHVKGPFAVRMLASSRLAGTPRPGHSRRRRTLPDLCCAIW